MDNKEYVLDLLRLVKRRNMDALIDWLVNKTDYFTAPASTKYHGSHKGGLVEHSIDVYRCFQELQQTPKFKECNFPDESVILMTLLHDVCKTNFYFEDKKNWKNPETDKWEVVPFYSIEDSHPYGHGECSVMLIEEYIKLNIQEKYAIRWHMGGFDKLVRGGDNTVSEVFKKSPVCLCLHMADMMATYLIGSREEKK